MKHFLSLLFTTIVFSPVADGYSPSPIMLEPYDKTEFHFSTDTLPEGVEIVFSEENALHYLKNNTDIPLYTNLRHASHKSDLLKEEGLPSHFYPINKFISGKVYNWEYIAKPQGHRKWVEVELGDSLEALAQQNNLYDRARSTGPSRPWFYKSPPSSKFLLSFLYDSQTIQIDAEAVHTANEDYAKNLKKHGWSPWKYKWKSALVVIVVLVLLVFVLGFVSRLIQKHTNRNIHWGVLLLFTILIAFVGQKISKEFQINKLFQEKVYSSEVLISGECSPPQKSKKEVEETVKEKILLSNVQSIHYGFEPKENLGCVWDVTVQENGGRDHFTGQQFRGPTRRYYISDEDLEVYRSPPENKK